jgi:hypothetical protein
VKHWQILLAIIAALSASLALADDFKTIKGKEYKNAKVSRVEPDGIVLITKSGISKVYFTELPKEVQKRFGYDADKLEAEKAAARAAEEKQIEEQKAAERERAEKEKNVEADLKRSVEKFQAAEQRASQSYQSAQKGTLSGQVFISTTGRENFKLGAVQVGLFARDAIDILLAELKKYADIKIQELSPSVDAAKAASEHADAADYISEASYKARDEYKKIRDKRDFYYSGAFFLGYLLDPIQAVETDADEKFAIEVPKQGFFVIAAKAERYVGKIYLLETGIDVTEHYYWLQPVSLDGQKQLTQNLSNNNLTSTTGTSA